MKDDFERCVDCGGKLYGLAQVVGKRAKSPKIVCLKCARDKHGIPLVQGERNEKEYAN